MAHRDRGASSTLYVYLFRLALRKDEGDRGRIVEFYVDLSRYGAPTGNNPILLRYLPQYNVFAPLDEG